MASIERIFIKDEWYHIYNRGNHKENIFRDRYDYFIFTKKLIELREEYKINIASYILMSNHFHILCSPSDYSYNISLLFSRLMNSYTKIFNIKYSEVGRLVQDRFKSKHIETEEYLLHLSRYIHLNAINSSLTSGVKLELMLDRYPYSSWREYLSGRYKVVNSFDILLDQFTGSNRRGQYLKFVKEYSKIHTDRKEIILSIQDNLDI